MGSFVSLVKKWAIKNEMPSRAHGEDCKGKIKGVIISNLKFQDLGKSECKPMIEKL